MQHAIKNIPKLPEVSLTTEVTVYIGQNKIRRNIASSHAFYAGTRVQDRVLEVPPGSSIDLCVIEWSAGDVFESATGEEEQTAKSLYLRTTIPLRAIINEQLELSVNKQLITDHPIKRLQLHNDDLVTSAKISISYLI
jgi:hypothetical protein